MGKGPTDTTQEITQLIPPEFMPFFKQLFQDAGAASEQVPTAPFEGSFIAPNNPLEQQSVDQRAQVGQQLQNIGQPVLDLGRQQAEGAFLGSNPFLQQAIQQSLAPAISEFQGNVLPAFESGALNQNIFKGGSARDIGLQGIAGDFGRNLAGTAGQIGFQSHALERQLQQNAPNLLQQGAGLQQLSPEILAIAGEGQRAISQRPLDEAQLQFQESISAPFRAVNQLAQIIQGTQIPLNQQTAFPQAGGAARGIAGGLGGAALGGLAGQQFGFNPAIGAGLGALGGGFGAGFGG